MKAKFSAIALLSALTLSGCVVHVGPNHAKVADVELTDSLQVDGQNLSVFNIDAGAGRLKIQGDAEATEISVKADIHTTEAKDYVLRLKRSGNTAYLVAEHNSTYGNWRGSSPRIDLEVIVPANTALNIDDGSGAIEINDLRNSVIIEDGSGAIELNNIFGEVAIDDNSGSISLRNIEGKIQIDDGHGSILVKNTNGDVNVEDGSGDMLISDVRGKVTIDDGSGDIDVLRTGGLTIIDAGSGDLNITDVRGDVDIDS